MKEIFIPEQTQGLNSGLAKEVTSVSYAVSCLEMQTIKSLILTPEVFRVFDTVGKTSFAKQSGCGHFDAEKDIFGSSHAEITW